MFLDYVDFIIGLIMFSIGSLTLALALWAMYLDLDYLEFIGELHKTSKKERMKNGKIK